MINPLSYTEENSLTVIDNNTGLIWQREDDRTARSWTNAVNYCENLSLNGQTDWRNDIFFAYGAGLDYQIRPWLSVGVEYLHTGRRSNFNEFDFQDDKFTARVTLQF